MNVAHAMKLVDWVGRKRQWILLDRPTQKQIAEQAATDLEMKVSQGAVRDALAHHGIQRKSRHEAECESLRGERDKYKRALVKVAAATQVPEWLRDELLADEDISEVIRDALAKSEAA